MRRSRKKAANNRRNDARKKRNKEARRDAGELPLHGEDFVRRYRQPDIITRDFDALEYAAVKGGDTGKNVKKNSQGNMPFERAEREGIPIFLWDGM